MSILWTPLQTVFVVRNSFPFIFDTLQDNGEQISVQRYRSRLRQFKLRVQIFAKSINYSLVVPFISRLFSLGFLFTNKNDVEAINFTTKYLLTHHLSLSSSFHSTRPKTRERNKEKLHRYITATTWIVLTVHRREKIPLPPILRTFRAKEGSVLREAGTTLVDIVFRRLFHSSALGYLHGERKQALVVGRDFYSRRLVYLYTATFPPLLDGWSVEAWLYENKPGFLSSHVFFLDFVPPLDEYSPRLVSCRVPSVCHDLFTNVDKRCWIPADSRAWTRRKWSMERGKGIYIYIWDGWNYVTEFEEDMDWCNIKNWSNETKKNWQAN